MPYANKPFLDIDNTPGFEEHALQPMFPDGSQAQTGVPEGGLQDAFHDDVQQVPRIKLQNNWNKPEPETESKYRPYGERGLTGRQLAGIRESFTGNDPLLCIEDEAARKQIESLAARFDVTESERIKKAVALAHYYSMGHREATGFIFGNLEAAIEQFEGKKMTVEQAYESVRQIYAPAEKSALAKTFENPVVAAATSGILNVAETTTNVANFAVGKTLKAAQMTDFVLLNFLGAVAHLSGFEETGKFLSSASDELPDWGGQYEKTMREAVEQSLGSVKKWEQQNMNVPEDWVTNSDSVGDWLANAGLSLIAYAPELAVQIGLGVATGGTSAIGLVYGINGYYDIKGDMPDVSEGEALAYGVGIGLINSVLEKVSLGIAEGKVSEAFAKHGIKKGLTRILAYLGTSATLEGAEEGVEEFAENLLDIAIGRRGETKEWTSDRWREELFRGVPEAAFLGFTTGFGMAAPGVAPLRARAEQNEATMRFVRSKKEELDAKETLTDGEALERSVLSAAIDSNDPEQVRKAAASVVLNHQLRVKQEREAARTRYEEAEARFNEAKEDPEARAEYEAARKEYVKAFPEEETELERARREAEAVHMARETTRRIGWNIQDTIDTVNDLAKQYPSISIHTVSTFDELPDAVKADQQRRGINKNRADAVWHNGEVYVIADKTRPGDVEKRLLHEVVGHEGLRRVFGKQYDAFLNDVFEKHQKEIEEMGLAALYHTTADTEAGRQYLADEFLARMAEQNVKPSWWKEMLAQIKAYLRKVMPNLHFSDAEIEAALVRSANVMRKQKQGSEAAGGTRLSVSPVWTGSAADYDQPSLNYVGTGEGAQVYGWGLYGSSSRDVAEWYAQQDAQRKQFVLPRQQVYLDGEIVEYPGAVNGLRAIMDGINQKGFKHTKEYLKSLMQELEDKKLSDNYAQQVKLWNDLMSRLEIKHDWRRIVQDALIPFEQYTDVKGLSEEEYLAAAKEFVPDRIELYISDDLASMEYYKNNRNEEKIVEYYERNIAAAREALEKFSSVDDLSEFRVQHKRNLYNQTFWPGKKENLVYYDEGFHIDQRRQIQKQADKENIKLPENLLMHKDFDYVYDRLSAVLGSPKAASEFLYRAGIDGVTYIGEGSGVRNYVAFSDADIQVNDHIRYSVAFDEEGNYYPGPDAWGTAYTSMTGKGVDAVHFLQDKKGGWVPAAWHRDDIGDIDVVYGETNGTDDRKDVGGWGIAHIDKKHNVDWDEVEDIVLRGIIKSRTGDKIILQKSGGKAIIGLEYLEEKRNWLVTAYGTNYPSSGILVAASRNKGAADSLAPRGIYNIGDAWPDVKLETEENEKFKGEDGEEVRYSIREEDPPKKTLKGYKVFAVKKNKPGQLFPPMVANPGGASTPVGVWLNADAAPRAEDSKTGRKRVQAGGKGTNVGKQTLAYRPGWHLGEVPIANQFMKKNPETGEKDLFPDNFVWAECEIAADVDYQEEAMSYGYNKNGNFEHAKAGLPRIPKDGFYRYRTNPDPKTEAWMITGAMKVTRILDDSDVNEILKQAGREPYKRQGGPIDLSSFGLQKGDTTKTRFSINPVWTGSAADYDAPDLNYVGTGEGWQVYGWGLYGSSERGVGEEYARADVKRKGLGAHHKYKFDGLEMPADIQVNSTTFPELSIDERFVLQMVSNIVYGNRNRISKSDLEDEVYQQLEDLFNYMSFRGKPAQQENVLAVAKDILSKIELNETEDRKPHNLYKQTFWPNKQENLLDWDKPISEEQANQILDAFSNESSRPEIVAFLNNEHRIDAENDGVEYAEEEEYFAPDVVRDEMERYMDLFEADGMYVYKQIADVLGSPKAASEFLLRAGIDGITYIGDSSGVRNYVAFSDKDISVDDHIRFSVAGTDEDLIAVHNVSEQKLRDAIKLGALPVPSLGIISANKSDFTDYGGITLVADKSLIDPKRPKNKVFNADIYSVRRPNVERKYTDTEFDRALEVIAPHEQHEPDSSDSIQRLVQQHRDDMRSSDFVDDLKNSDAVRNWYLDTRDGEEKFADWWIRVAEPELDLHPEERIFDGYTNSGRRRYLPANLETIVRLMTRKVKDSEGFFYGVGNIRANMARQFKSISEIQKNRDKIVSGEDYKKIKEEVTQEFNELLDHIKAAITGNNISHSYDTASDLLRAMAEGPGKRENREWLIEALGDFSNPIYKDMAEFLLKLRDLPTPLFEAKPQRAVYLEEFKAAIVPEETANDILRALEEAGVEVFTYENDAARKATLQSVTSERGLRFSLDDYSDEDKRQIVTMLKPKWMEEAFVEPSEVKAYLESMGEKDVDENDAWSFYHMAGREIKAEKKKADDKKRDKWIYENDLLYHDAVDYAGADFKIIPAFRHDNNDEWPGTFIAENWRKYGKKRPQGKRESGLHYQEYLRKREEALTSEHQEGVFSDVLAEYIARKRGGDTLDIEEQLIEHFRNMTQPKLWQSYYKFKKEENYRNKVEQNEAEEEYAAFKKEQIENTVKDIVSNKGQITAEWAMENPDVFKELFRVVMKTEPPRSRRPSKANLDAINAALADEDINAASYKAARAAAFAEFQRKLTELRQEMNEKNANAAKLQREAAAFAEEHLPPEQRGMFTRGIIKLLDYDTGISKKYPEGRRMHEFHKLQEAILKEVQTKRTEESIGHIREMLDAVKMKRNWKGIPTSVIPSEQARVDRIRKIVDMTPASVANALEYNNAKILELESGIDKKFEDGEPVEDISAERAKLVEDNALLETFGNLGYRKPDAVTKAEEFLQDLIKGGKAKFKSLLAQQAGRVMEMRQQAVNEITGGKGIVKTGGAVGSKDAKNHTPYILKNMRLGSLLQLVASKAGIDFDSTVAGKLWRGTEDSTQKEMTANRHLQEDFDAEIEDILGTSEKSAVEKMRLKGKFLKSLSKVEENTGVFKTQYSRQKVIDPMEAPIVQVGMSSSKVHLIPVEDYKRRVRNADGTYDEVECPGVRSILRMIDNGGEFEPEDGITLDETGVFFLRKQLEDYDAGIDRRFDFFKDEIDAESANRLKEDSEKDKLAVIFRGKNVTTDVVEVPLSQGTALQVLLTWEQEDFRPNMKWNGWSDESIEQIKKFLKPEALRLGYWMRDYFAKQRAELDEAVVKRYGAHLPENPNYWPGRFAGARTSIGTNGMRGAGTMNINPNFLIARKFHLSPLDMDVDAFSVFFDGQIHQNHFLAWTDNIRDMREVFGDSDVQKAINENFGSDVTKNLVERVVTIAQGGAKHEAIADIISRLSRYWIPAKIALNPSSYIKQGLGNLAYMNSMPAKEYIKYFSRANFSNPDYRAFAQMALNSDYLKNRMAGGLDKDLIYMMQNTRDNAQYSPLADSLISAATYGTKHADRWSALHGGFAVYQYNLEQARKSGLSKKDAEERARRAWMRATDETQQSGYLKDLNYYQQNQGAVRFLTAFLSNPIQVMNLELQTLNEIKYNPDNAEAKRKLAKQIIVNHLIVPTLMQFTSDMMRYGFDIPDWWSEEEFEDYFHAWLLGPFEGLFFLGKAIPQFMNTLEKLATGRRNKASGFGIDSVPLLNELARSGSSFRKDLRDEEFTAQDIADGLAFAGDIGMLYGATPAPGAAEAGALGTVANAIGVQWKRIIKAFNRWDEDEEKKTSTSRRGSYTSKRRK